MRSKSNAIVLTATAVFAALFFAGCGAGYVTPDIPSHLISSPDISPVRPIDGAAGVELSALPDAPLTEQAYRARVDELYSIVVYDGNRPIFAQDDPVEAIYVSARAALDRYIVNAWHDGARGQYEIVHAVHDYLACNIDYDFELYERYLQGESELANDPAFYIDGVFSNGKAVCDGLSRAFDFLCAIEGVRSTRVTGSFGSGPHAWNKVNIGGEWFNVDVTADCAYYMTAEGMYKKQLSHGFFLLSDKTMREFNDGHVFEEQPFVAERDFDFYATEDKSIVIGGIEYPRVVKSAAALNALFGAVKKAKGEIGKLEVKLDFDGKAQVNAADMYADEIRTAYGAVNDSAYKIGEGITPYFRYPNGVYLFLIYK